MTLGPQVPVKCPVFGLWGVLGDAGQARTQDRSPNDASGTSEHAEVNACPPTSLFFSFSFKFINICCIRLW